MGCMSQAATRARPLSNRQRKDIAKIVQREGERRTGEILQVSRQTLGRSLAGLPVQHATAALLASRLAALQTEGAR